jgi:hypothetical protein
MQTKLLHKKFGLDVIDSETYHKDENRYEIRSGSELSAPSCPFENKYKLIGFDKYSRKYVRFSKSVYRKLLQDYNPK